MQKKVISVSRRTDISSFYSNWFFNRVRAGYCTVGNPYNPKQVSRISLRPEDVCAFVFWTRNPKPMMKYLRDLDQLGFHYYFLVTVTGYPKELEPAMISLDDALNNVRECADMIGPEKVIWRYDPIMLSNSTDEKWHKKNFRMIAKKLSGATERVIVSIIDPYQKTTRRLKQETRLDFLLHEDAFKPEAYTDVLAYFASVARAQHIEIQMCAEEYDFSSIGIPPGKCIDDRLIERITGITISPKKDASQRKHCGCVKSKDIGYNNTCLYGCLYCYATRKIEEARKNFTQHDVASPSLVGWVDVDAPQKNVVRQKELF